jgi:two-component system response regulator MprA
MLPGMDGFSTCARIRGITDVPVLMLTGRDAVNDRVKGLKTGADDYIVKPFAVEELLARIEALLRRRVEATPPELVFGDVTLDMQTRALKRGQREASLSTTEFDLLVYFMRHPRQVLTRAQLMEAVWGYDFSGSSNVLDVYVGYLRSKLEDNEEPRLIHTVRGAGYVLRD